MAIDVLVICNLKFSSSCHFCLGDSSTITSGKLHKTYNFMKSLSTTSSQSKWWWSCLGLPFSGLAVVMFPMTLFQVVGFCFALLASISVARHSTIWSTGLWMWARHWDLGWYQICRFVANGWAPQDAGWLVLNEPLMGRVSFSLVRLPWMQLTHKAS